MILVHSLEHGQAELAEDLESPAEGSHGVVAPPAPQLQLGAVQQDHAWRYAELENQG